MVNLVMCPFSLLYNDCALLVGFIGFVVPILIYRAEQNLVFVGGRLYVGNIHIHNVRVGIFWV